MTTTGGHPLDDVLAEHAEGVLEGAQANAVEEHLAACEACRDTLADLTEVTHMLQRAPGTLPIPAEVSARVFAALAAETTVAAADPEADAAVVPLRRRTSDASADGPVAWFRRRLPQTLAAAASLAVIAFASYVVTSGGGTDGADDASAGQEEAGDSALSEAAPQADGADTYSLDERTDAELQGDVASGTTAALSQRIADVWRGELSYSAADGCGRALADEQSETLVGSTDFEADVLVVLQSADGTQLTGWRLTTCSDLAGQAVADPVTIDTPTD